MRYLLTLCCLLPLATAQADERILRFHSDIAVYPDGMIEVTETIAVQAEGQQIRRGIYRDIPVDYEDRLGNVYTANIEPLSVTRNDAAEAFHSVRSRRDIRTYFGRSDRLIEPGTHVYRYRYRASRMLGFFDEHDELYWNVTGNRFLFPIDAASATVTLNFDVPPGAIIVEAYTGAMGSKAQAYSRSIDEAGAVTFWADRGLPPGHGLTIVVGWPKGYVAEPTLGQRIGWVLRDNRNLVAALLGFLLLLAYYIPVWLRYGRDLDDTVIVTRYEPPQDFSPASLRYIRQMYYDDKVMTAAIVNLAVKGYLEIKKKGKTHSLIKRADEPGRAPLAAGERELMQALFKHSRNVTLKNRNHEQLGAARSAHRASLQQDYRNKYFKWNGMLNIPGVVIALLTLVVTLSVGGGRSLLVVAVFVLMFLTLIFFAVIMKRPTLRGQQLLSEMLGFKDYLEVAEKDELNLRNPPEKTPQLFESYLPFALALGVDQQWAERFAGVLAAVRGADGEVYSPSWYNGTWDGTNLTQTTQGLTSGLNSAVSESVTAPGSASGSGFSSGGGGGGSSGGGGGGGGGGGW